MNRSISNGQTTTKLDGLAYALATGLGAGFTPIAPGTVGAVEGVAIFLAIRAVHLGRMSSLLVMVVVNVVVFLVGVWASNRACRISGIDDPRQIVIDEVSGQLIALTPLALLPSLSVTSVVVGFVLFRVFDIFKPYPIRKLERLPAGLGVMSDDSLAGVYAAVLVWLGVHFQVL
jgi:phosphatidylglycerophosphatase A